jgi:hypothetical protein
VRAKNATKPPGLIRFVLSADPRLQRISVRRIRVRLKNARKSPRSRRLKDSVRTKKSERLPWAMNAPAVLLAVICVMGAAALIAARQPSQRADVTAVEPEPVTAPVRLETRKTVPSKAPAAAVAARAHAADRAMENMPAVELASALTKEPAANPPTVEFAAKAPAVESTSTAVQNSAPVTITGCLERDEETIWLKDTSGTDAPKSRSWRSGFLKKRSLPIELIDPADTLTLPNHAGQRVAATGMLLNREMRVHSLQRVGASCR